MLTRRSVVSMASVAMMVLSASMTYGQGYPNKPVRIIGGGPTSSGTIMIRFVAEEISGPLGQQVVVESRPSGALQGEIVAKSPPDGYTLVMSGSGLWIETLTRKRPYDPIKDFAPISMIGRLSNVIVVNASLPVKSLKELIALAKAKPGELNNSIGGVGSNSHLAVELFKSMAGVKIVSVPYSSDTQEIQDLIGGRVHMTLTNPGAVMQHVKAGKLRALAITGAEPTPLIPGVPTIAESGVPGYSWADYDALLAPAGTPAAIVQRLNQEVVRALRTTGVKEKFFKLGLEAYGSTPEELSATIKSDMARVSKVLKETGIKVE